RAQSASYARSYWLPRAQRPDRTNSNWFGAWSAGKERPQRARRKPCEKTPVHSHQPGPGAHAYGHFVHHKLCHCHDTTVGVTAPRNASRTSTNKMQVTLEVL